MESKILDLLHQLGMTSNYKGYHYLTYGLLLLFEDPQRLTNLTKELYPMIAKKFKSSPEAVERSMRTIIRLAWAKNSDLIKSKLGCIGQQSPRIGDFLGAAYYRLLEESKLVWQKEGF